MNEVRLITTREGKFVNVDDFKRGLKDDQFVDQFLVPLLKVGHEKGDSVTQIVRVICGAALCELASEGPDNPS